MKWRTLLLVLLWVAALSCRPIASLPPSPTLAPVTQTFSMPAPTAAQEKAVLPMSSTVTDLPSAYISFIINVHDWTHPAESADILLKLIALFEQYGVRSDFYFTAEITRELVEKYPEVIGRFRNSNMTISYHVRPPHPLYTGFDAHLKGLDDAALSQAILDYETHALNLRTGELDWSRPGGYTYVAQVFGHNPVVTSVPSDDRRLKDAAQRVYASLGAQMTLLYHEEGTKLEQPFEYVNGLLVRPSDFSVTRVTSIDGSNNFWWNYMSRPNAADYNPTKMLQNLLADWEQRTSASPYARPPFVTVLIHENNFYRTGPEGWKSIYFAMNGPMKGSPLHGPWNLNAPDPSKPRTEADKAAIFAAYEELVAYAAQHLSVVTSEDIVALAIKEGWNP